MTGRATTSIKNCLYMQKGQVMREEDAGCLTDNEVAGFVEGNVQPDELPRLESHLAECAKCLEIVLAVFNSLADSRDLFPRKTSL